ncbi:MAG: potassium channel protein [Calditrichaeota bacterium]|nr:potassium channel protein [Calditrichota bacterium]
MKRKLITEFIGPLVTLFLIYCIGAYGFYVISDYKITIGQALYMTFITITTIGFHEVIPISGNDSAQYFTMAIAFSGIAITAYLLSQMTALIVQGRIQDNLRRRKMVKKSQQLKNHYIICGYGKTGGHILSELNDSQLDAVVVDINDARLEDLLSNTKQLAIFGDATKEEVLKNAGIHHARGIFTVTKSDNTNLVITLTARNLNKHLRIVSSCTETENIDKLYIAGANAVITPSHIGALRMTSIMFKPTVVTFLDSMLKYSDGNLHIDEIEIPDSLVGKSIHDLNLVDFPKTLIMAIKHSNEWIYNPSRTYSFQKNDLIIILTVMEEHRRFKECLV